MLFAKGVSVDTGGGGSEIQASPCCRFARNVTQVSEEGLRARVRGVPALLLRQVSDERKLFEWRMPPAKKGPGFSVQDLIAAIQNGESEFEMESEDVTLMCTKAVSMGYEPSDVVMKLASTLPEGQNYKIYADNYFTCVPLVVKLLDHGIHYVGQAECEVRLFTPHEHSQVYLVTAERVVASEPFLRGEVTVPHSTVYRAAHCWQSYHKVDPIKKFVYS
ncbi:hypothetical protein NQZ68_000971 [Dissostichus eleginoides]|nr:hypothetical protein NQZ68_000971 [Dissostichus eleginoides]